MSIEINLTEPIKAFALELLKSSADPLVGRLNQDVIVTRFASLHAAATDHDIFFICEVLAATNISSAVISAAHRRQQDPTIESFMLHCKEVSYRREREQHHEIEVACRKVIRDLCAENKLKIEVQERPHDTPYGGQRAHPPKHMSWGD